MKAVAVFRFVGAYIASAICLWPLNAWPDETAADLWQAGYQIVRKFAYAEVEECSPDKPVALDEFIFICSGYEYPYSYGKAFLVGMQGAVSGQTFTSYYLCLEDGEKCIQGQLYRK
jgi:hypothetical protein